MTIRLRTAFFIFLGILLIWFLYIVRTILSPFILAACFAYIINPIVNFFSHKVKLPRSLSIIIIYLFITGILVAASIFLSKQVSNESMELRNATGSFVKNAQTQVNTLPDWIQPSAKEFIVSLNTSKLFSPQWLIAFFPQAISRAISFLIFLFATFYFLKEGRDIFDKILLLVPNDYKIEVAILLRKMNAVFGGYLRGQFLLIVIVSAVLFIALTILGVKFALIVAIFSGVAEIVPFVGPYVAGFVACLIVVMTGTTNFNLTLIQAILAVILIYFVVRQIEDYFIAPHILGKVTKLHPFLIFFAVLAGGHLMGILGLILAVPVAGAVRIILEYCFDKITLRSLANASKTSLKK